MNVNLVVLQQKIVDSMDIVRYRLEIHQQCAEALNKYCQESEKI